MLIIKLNNGNNCDNDIKLSKKKTLKSKICNNNDSEIKEKKK